MFLKKMKFSHRVEISIISVFQYYSTIKSKFSQNYNFRELFSKGALLFSGGGAQNFKLAGAKSLQGGKQVQGGALLPPLWKKARVRVLPLPRATF